MPRIHWNGPFSNDEAVKVCPHCDGSTFEDEFTDEPCHVCLGAGEVPGRFA